MSSSVKDYCFLCDEWVTSQIKEYGEKQYYCCPDCGEYQLTNGGKCAHFAFKQALRDKIKAAQALNTADHVIEVGSSLPHLVKRQSLV